MRLSLNIYAMAYAAGIYNPDGHVPYFQSATDFLPFVEKVGLTTLELPLDYFFGRLDHDDFTSFMTAAHQRGIKIFPAIENFDTQFFKENLGHMSAYGWQNVRIKMPHLGDTFYGGNRHLSKHFNHSLASFKKALDAIEDDLAAAGVAVAIENHQDVDAYELLAICQSAKHGMRRITWDVGNSLSTYHTAEQFVQITGAYIANIHLKDYTINKMDEGIALRRSVLGEGFIDLDNMARLINTLPACANVSMELAAHPDRVCRIYDPSYHQNSLASDDDKAVFTQFINEKMVADTGATMLKGEKLTYAELIQTEVSCDLMRGMFA